MRIATWLCLILSPLFLVVTVALAADAQQETPAVPTEPTPAAAVAELAAPVAPNASAISTDPEANFREGVIAFQKNDLKKARTLFETALVEENPATLFNLGLVEQKAGHLGLSIALWRKALALQPDFEPAQRAVRWSKTKLERPEIAHEVEVWESFRSAALATIPLPRYLLATAFLLFTSGWLLLSNFGRRHRARLEEKPMPGFPTLGFIGSLLCIATGLLSAAKAYDQQSIRGTVVEKKIEARSSPDKSGTPLFDLYEGLEVIVRQDAGEWMQVTYPGGSTGWVPKTSILAVTDDARKRAAL